MTPRDHARAHYIELRDALDLTALLMVSDTLAQHGDLDQGTVTAIEIIRDTLREHVPSGALMADHWRARDAAAMGQW